MLDVTKSLPEDPAELRAFTALLLAEVKSQAVLIRCPATHACMCGEKLRHQLAGQRAHRFGPSSETSEQLQLALEMSEIAIAALTAKLSPARGYTRRQAEAQADPGSHSARGGRADPRQHGLRPLRLASCAGWAKM
ncbi:MAG: transposase [Cypionkella sp.]